MYGGDVPVDPRWYPDDYPGEVPAIANANSDLGGHYSTDDLFELVWQGGGGGGVTGQPAFSRLRSSQSPAIPPSPPLPFERMPLDKPPFEDVMAAWLHAIVSGQQDHDGDVGKMPMTKEASEMIGSSRTVMTERKGQHAASFGMSGTMDTSIWVDSGGKKTSGSGSSIRKESSHYSVTHSTTEKRRRCRITERLRTLQQLVPGCDKSNQASTLEQTIQYMKSLQQQVQPMNTMPASPASATAAVYPFAMPMQPIAPGTAIPHAGIVPMVPFGAMLPYAHYHAVMMAAAAAAAPRYPPAPAGASSGARDATGDHGQCSVSLEQQQHQPKREKGRRRV